MQLPLYQIDAFARRPFTGNPAAVIPLSEWLPDHLLQAIAAENNLSETAFFVPLGAAASEDFHLRWFTPADEIDLCGHATLASAYALFEILQPGRDHVRFKTLSGTLQVSAGTGGLRMDLPARPAAAQPLPQAVAAALGVQPRWSGLARDWLLVLASEQQLRDLKPDLAALQQASKQAVIVTAAGEEVDFVSRFFAPQLGVLEDPVTGSAHCTLAPYWARQLGKQALQARQLSARQGDLHCVLDADRVFISGHCVLYLRGEISV